MDRMTRSKTGLCTICLLIGMLLVFESCLILNVVQVRRYVSAKLEPVKILAMRMLRCVYYDYSW